MCWVLIVENLENTDKYERSRQKNYPITLPRRGKHYFTIVTFFLIKRYVKNMIKYDNMINDMILSYMIIIYDKYDNLCFFLYGLLRCFLMGSVYFWSSISFFLLLKLILDP